MIVVIGGQSRKVGKTRAVCGIISATREAAWTAVKISPHEHAENASANPDTGRYLAAGAAATHLITTGVSPVVLPPARNLIIESNRIVHQFRADITVFIRDISQPEWKESAAAIFENADFICDREITPEVIEAVRAYLSERQS